MRVSYNWLKELVNVPDDPKELANRLDLTGTAVDGIEAMGEILDGVIVGLIVEKIKHPNADTLWITKVDIGDDEPLQIVCGAQNFNAGDKVPVATVGTTLPNGVKIKKSKLRGEVSMGMNCSAAELGVAEDAAGLLILDADAAVGQAFAEYIGKEDTILDLEITPNRGDCLSMVGMAREVGAVYDLPINRVVHKTQNISNDPAGAYVSVSIEDSKLCPRYSACVIKGVRVGPSPTWITERLQGAGIRPINNIVDATNYILLELGQPLHAFDLDTLTKDAKNKAKIIVRRAKQGEKVVTLDSEERLLDQDMIVIADENDPIALAGVMGGLETEISDTTTDILLESAVFSPEHTSRTSRKLGLISEASMRYERGVDANQTLNNAREAAALIVSIAGGAVCIDDIDEYPNRIDPWTVALDMSEVHALIGEEIDQGSAAAILRRLGCEVAEQGTTLSVSVPTFRGDLVRPADLIEEILRIWGMERVTSTLPGGREKIGGLDATQRIKRHIGQLLRASGLNETMTYAFGSEAELGELGFSVSPEKRVTLLNPMSSEQDMLRTTVIPGLIKSVAYNQSRGVSNIHLYEIGTVFVAREGKKLPKESQVLAGVLAGKWDDDSWNQKWPTLDFFDGKGVLENVFEKLGVEKFRFASTDVHYLQPGRGAEITLRGTNIGYLGEVHPSLLEKMEATGPVVVFEIALAPLIKATREVRPYTEIPRFPAVELDAAFIVDEDVSVERIKQAMRSAGKEMLESIRLFDVYRSQSIGAGKKSLAFALTYRDPSKTLTSAEVQMRHDKLVSTVGKVVDAQLRQ